MNQLPAFGDSLRVCVCACFIHEKRERRVGKKYPLVSAAPLCPRLTKEERGVAMATTTCSSLVATREQNDTSQEPGPRKTMAVLILFVYLTYCTVQGKGEEEGKSRE